MVRLLILHRPWHQPWDYRADDLDTAAGVLESLYGAAGRLGATAASGAVMEALLDDLDVPRAVAIAQEQGGEAARLVLKVLSLT